MPRKRASDDLPPLTPREERLACLLAQGNISVSEACRQVGIGGPDGYKGGNLYRRIKPDGDLGRHIRARARALGLTLDVGLLKVREKLDAKETRFFQKDGVVTESRDVEAHRIQLDAARTVLEIHDAFPRPQQEAHTPVTITVLGINPAALRPPGMDPPPAAMPANGKRPGQQKALTNGDRPRDQIAQP